MRRILIQIACIFMVAVQAGCSLAHPYLIQVHRLGDSYEVSNLASEFYVYIPMKNYVRERPANGNKDQSYFFFNDENRGMIISGWIVSAEDYPGKEAFWNKSVAEWKELGLSEPQNIEQVKIGNWDGTFYDDLVPFGTHSNLRAHWIEYGTWLDIHMSISSLLSSQECRDRLIEELKGIRIQKRHL